jgi:NET1-associated nuclear protein 1 (U3 small nucleolar RNA-associated protein 17)
LLLLDRQTHQADTSSRYFFSVAGSVVKIHSITTGEVVSTLSVLPLIHGPEDVSSSAAPGHSQAITGVVINPENAFQLITSSLDGTLKVWDYMDGALLQTIDLAQPIFCLCAHAASSRYVFVAAGRSSSSKRSSKSGDTFVISYLNLS